MASPIIKAVDVGYGKTKCSVLASIGAMFEQGSAIDAGELQNV